MNALPGIGVIVEVGLTTTTGEREDMRPHLLVTELNAESVLSTQAAFSRCSTLSSTVKPHPAKQTSIGGVTEAVVTTS
jgi:hypothetical protein